MDAGSQRPSMRCRYDHVISLAELLKSKVLAVCVVLENSPGFLLVGGKFLNDFLDGKTRRVLGRNDPRRSENPGDRHEAQLSGDHGGDYTLPFSVPTPTGDRFFHKAGISMGRDRSRLESSRHVTTGQELLGLFMRPSRTRVAGAYAFPRTVSGSQPAV